MIHSKMVQLYMCVLFIDSTGILVHVRSEIIFFLIENTLTNHYTDYSSKHECTTHNG